MLVIIARPLKNFFTIQYHSSFGEFAGGVGGVGAGADACYGFGGGHGGLGWGGVGGGRFAGEAWISGGGDTKEVLDAYRTLSKNIFKYGFNTVK